MDLGPLPATPPAPPSAPATPLGLPSLYAGSALDSLSVPPVDTPRTALELQPAPTTPATAAPPVEAAQPKFRHPFRRLKRPAWGGVLAFALYLAATAGYLVIRSMFTLPRTYAALRYGCS